MFCMRCLLSPLDEAVRVRVLYMPEQRYPGLDVMGAAWQSVSRSASQSALCTSNHCKADGQHGFR